MSTTEGIIRCAWCNEPLEFVPGRGWLHSDGQLYRTKRHERCPYCGSYNIKEVKPLFGVCIDCEGSFHMEYDDHCALPRRV